MVSCLRCNCEKMPQMGKTSIFYVNFNMKIRLLDLGKVSHLLIYGLKMKNNHKKYAFLNFYFFNKNLFHTFWDEIKKKWQKLAKIDKIAHSKYFFLQKSYFYINPNSLDTSRVKSRCLEPIFNKISHSDSKLFILFSDKTLNEQ